MISLHIWTVWASRTRATAGVNLQGRDTDQGRIYLKYGEPDEVETHMMIEHAKPHEHWRYYQTGYHFIFVDVRGDSRSAPGLLQQRDRAQ